jgi:hypothetical protein
MRSRISVHIRRNFLSACPIRSEQKSHHKILLGQPSSSGGSVPPMALQDFVNWHGAALALHGRQRSAGWQSSGPQRCRCASKGRAGMPGTADIRGLARRSPCGIPRAERRVTSGDHCIARFASAYQRQHCGGIVVDDRGLREGRETTQCVGNSTCDRPPGCAALRGIGQHWSVLEVGCGLDYANELFVIGQTH